MQKGNKKKQLRKPQHQQRPGIEKKLTPRPVFDFPDKKGTNKLNGKIALITGADSGIGKAVAVLFAKEGADIAIAYLNEHKDARDTARIIQKKYKKRCLLIPGDLSSEKHCKTVIQKVVKEYKRIDLLVNNAALHYENKSLEDLTTRELLKTFGTNIFSFFWLTREALPYMKKKSSIINTASVTAYRGSAGLIDYAATKGAIVSFTRSLSANLVKKGIRVNGVAPGPIWTPLIASSFPRKKVAQFGSEVPMGRAGEPAEIAPAYLFLACDDSSYITGQFLHPNGGEIING
ncbi:MAG TPA: SDR family oxidoreductase [Chitinophagaceae bacterium]|nr:SDR family oxidoreductase [Chitinophagaceae bacterium]